MGIVGLQSFMERQGLVSYVNIGHLAQQFRETHNTTPILIMDSSCFKHIYNHVHTDDICGGQLKEHMHILDKLIAKLHQCGITCIVFADSYPPDHRIRLWMQRRMDECVVAGDIMSAIEPLKNPKDKETELKKIDNRQKLSIPTVYWSILNFFRNTCAGDRHEDVAKNIFRKKLHLFQTTREADDEILDFLHRNKCLGVMAQDSDFAIAQGDFHYFSMQHLDLRTMETIEYRRDKLAQYLGLRSDMLPLFATLSGNDVVKPTDLHKFHLQLLRKERNYEQLSQRPFLPKYLLFPKIAVWINNHMAGKILLSNPERAAEMIGLHELRESFSSSVRSYFPSKDTLVIAPSGDDTWDRIVEATNLKLKYYYQYPRINSVITLNKCFHGANLQYYTKAEYPCDGIVCEKLRHKLYGILLKEHPQSASIKVTEYVAMGPNTDKPQLVRPIYPGNHPGLLTMWSDDRPTDGKWNLCCWAIGDNVPIKAVRALPERLQIPTLAIFYITREFPNLLQKWEVSLLAFQAVLLLKMNAFQLRELKCTAEEPVAVHLATVYQSVCMWICTIADACGNPVSLFKFRDYAMFDGKLFHSAYVSFKKTGSVSYEIKSDEANLHKQILAIVRV